MCHLNVKIRVANILAKALTLFRRRKNIFGCTLTQSLFCNELFRMFHKLFFPLSQHDISKKKQVQRNTTKHKNRVF